MAERTQPTGTMSSARHSNAYLGSARHPLMHGSSRSAGGGGGGEEEEKEGGVSSDEEEVDDCIVTDAYSGNMKTVLHFLLDGIDANTSYEGREERDLVEGDRPLHAAIRGLSDHPDVDVKIYYMIINLLLNHGADINIQNSDGNTPIMCCSDAGALSLLLHEVPGLDLNIQNEEGETVLHLQAMTRGSELVIKDLVDAGANMDIVSRERIGRRCAWTPLFTALYNGNRRNAARLLMEGADDRIDCGGTSSRVETALDYAARIGIPPEAWEGMKGRMYGEKIDRTLNIAMRSTTASETNVFLGAFCQQVPEAMLMMEDVMEFLIGPMDPYFK